MNRQRALKQKALRAGVYLIPAFDSKTQNWLTKRFDLYVESESILGPRGLNLSRREAVRFAAQIASHPAGKIRFSYSA